MSTPRIDTIEQNLQGRYRNFLINGNFDFFQRNTSQVLTGSQFVTDRFRVFHNGTYVSQLTGSLSTDVPTVAQSGFQSSSSLKITKSTSAINPAATDYAYISQQVEGYNYAEVHGGRLMGLVFWVKSSVAGIFSANFKNSAQNRTYTADFTITSANTWERKTITFNTDTTGTWLFTNGGGLELGITLAAGSNYRIAPGAWTAAQAFGSTNQTAAWSNTSSASEFYLSQVMLVPIDSASQVNGVFRRSGTNVQQELAACQRYYYSILFNSADGQGYIGSGQSFTTDLCRVYHAFPTAMRIYNPTLSFSAVGDFVVLGGNGTPTAATAITLDQAHATGAGINFTKAGAFGGGGQATLARGNVPAAQMAFNAEL